METEGLKVHPVISKLRVRVTRGGMMNPERIRQSIFCIVGQAYLCQRVWQDEGTTGKGRQAEECKGENRPLC